MTKPLHMHKTMNGKLYQKLNQIVISKLSRRFWKQ